jgi:hydrogenase maturation protease
MPGSAAALTARKRVLVAGIGNIFLGDDGLGVEVARRLRDTPMGHDVVVADFGIRGIHLAFELADGGYDAAILVDAIARGSAPGTLYAIEPELDDAAQDAAAADAHSLTPDAVLAWIRRVGASAGRIVVVGCEPATVDESIGLSAPVEAAIDGAIAMIRSLVAEMTGAASCA